MAVRLLPFREWLPSLGPDVIKADIAAGLAVAMVLVPQSLAYAQLAGLPAHYGLYASLLPPLIAALFGSSRQLSTGPVTIVSMVTAAALQPLASSGSAGYVVYATLLAIMAGCVQVTLGVFRAGLLVNLLSRPVIYGFTNAASIIAIVSQLPKLLGLHIQDSGRVFETALNILQALDRIHGPTLLMGLLTVGAAWIVKRKVPRLPGIVAAVVLTTLVAWIGGYDRREHIAIDRFESPEVREELLRFNVLQDRLDALGQERRAEARISERVRRSAGPRSVEAVHAENVLELIEAREYAVRRELHALRQTLGTLSFIRYLDNGEYYYRQFRPGDPGVSADRLWRLAVGGNRLDHAALVMKSGGEVVGDIPAGLPSLTLPGLTSSAPDLSVLLQLLPTAAIICLLGFAETISISRAMASRTGQILDPDQELFGQGLANIAGGLTSGYPVSGSFSRSAINLRSGAMTGLSGVAASGFVALTLFFLTPLLYHMPQAVLAAVIVMAVWSLIDIHALVHAYRARWFDGLAGAATFLSTLAFAPRLDRGLAVGVGISLWFYVQRRMKPKTATLSMHPDCSLRDAKRYNLRLCKYIAVIRFDGQLFFANANYLEKKIAKTLRVLPDISHILIVANGINDIDATGEECLSSLVERLRSKNIDIYFSGCKDTILDVMKSTYLYDKIGPDHFFRNEDAALAEIHPKAHRVSDEAECPLTTVCPLVGERWEKKKKKFIQL